MNACILNRYPGLRNDTLPHWLGLNSVLPDLASFADVTVIFDTEDKLVEYVKSYQYATPGNEQIYAAIVFESGAPHWSYSLRFNISEMQFMQQGSPIDDSEVGLVTDSLS
jgi:hypothetical protein